jgi:hypothetical protein
VARDGCSLGEQQRDGLGPGTELLGELGLFGGRLSRLP